MFSHKFFFSIAAVVFLAMTGCRSVESASLEAVNSEPRELRVAAIFSDNMVLQQGMSVPVWGWATDGATVTVTFRNQTVSAKAKNGKWSLRLASVKAGGPDVMTITASRPSSTLVFTNVLVGEVWVCSGQSNMDWPMSKAHEPEADIEKSANPMVRLFTVPKVKADEPQENLKIDDRKVLWREANPETVPSFSAVAYYFGRELQKVRGVPIGLIHVAWGGSPAEAWTRREVLAGNSRYRTEVIDAYAIELKNFEQALTAFETAKKEGAVKKEAKPPAPPRWKPSELYNGMIAPIAPYAIAGAIWYQGENNVPRAHQYRDLLADMIQNWRRDWGQGPFPFLLVQLAPFKPIQPQPGESDWAELREAQLLVSQRLPKVGLAVITDVGEQHDIHPRRKAPVGGRLALAARKIAYGEDLVFSGPVYKGMKVQGEKVILKFEHVGGGLEARGGALKGFAICGPDRKFVWALAEIQPDNTVAVWSPNVPEPVAVRYGWSDFPVGNLWNREGLPASPFRTDDFPMITAPKGE